LEPVGETLDAGGLAWGQRTILSRMDEHQPVFAEMGHDGAAQSRSSCLV
jgi:hypothetical protein